MVKERNMISTLYFGVRWDEGTSRTGSRWLVLRALVSKRERERGRERNGARDRCWSD